MFTTSSFQPIDRKPEASDGNRSQGEMAFLAKVAMPHWLDLHVLIRTSFNGALVAAAQHCGMDDQEIADQIPISHGYMSRFMRGVAQQWAKRLVMFMRITQSVAPLQWIAHEMGCDITLRDRHAAELAAARARLAELERGGRAA